MLLQKSTPCRCAKLDVPLTTDSHHGERMPPSPRLSAWPSQLNHCSSHPMLRQSTSHQMFKALMLKFETVPTRDGESYCCPRAPQSPCSKRGTDSVLSPGLCSIFLPPTSFPSLVKDLVI